MARKAKHDWPYWWAVWQKVREKTPGIKLKDFCSDNDLPYDSCQMAFKRIEKKPTNQQTNKPTNKKPTNQQISNKRKRHNWTAYKEDFLRGDYASLAEFAREKGIDPKNSNFERKTKGWLDEKGEIRGKVQQNIVAQIGQRIAADIHGRALVGYYSCVDDLEAVISRNEIVNKNIVDPKSARDKLSGALLKTQILEKAVPAIKNIEGRPSSEDIMGRLMKGEIDVLTAALEHEMLGLPIPETIKIRLSRLPEPEQVEPEVHDLLNDEELERLHQEGLQNEQRQIEWVPEREAEIEAIKKEMQGQDSFAIEKLLGEASDKLKDGEA